ncbi:hypothetical protein [Anaeromyxobacter oryzae]|uniref:Uncharacterized protein n=1 Tax=Anaeromyxobacter oryzae TaxID=2918170 RepID=A0ABM7WY57_9BACT|nr:hypothetical protein [Anaeromyxobacter oryzae]BDG04462.1 hypothetical protein AMOR_34580 [Anaeromyxobacter oryzae]
MTWRSICAAALVAAAGAATAADAPRLKPFVLASRGAGEVPAAAAAVKAKLSAAGFELVGEYAPYDGAVVLAVTSADLRAAAAQNRFGGYGAAQRVSVTKVSDEVQVAYTNPVYMAAAYRMKADLSPVAAALGSALGRLEEFGPGDGRTAKDLRGYHYTLGMPYFDEPWKLGAFASQADAIAAVEAGLAAGRGGTRKVYRIDLPGADESVFGVALSDGCGGDGSVMREIDFKPLRSTGHLPYELVVSKGQVLALHAKFRIAVNFPDLSMMGSHSFMNIRCAPDSIEGALRKVVGR